MFVGKIIGGDKYGGLAEKPPNYPRHKYPDYRVGYYCNLLVIFW